VEKDSKLAFPPRHSHLPALALKSKGHDVHMYTSHHDPGHCFQETRDGTIKVTVYGDWCVRVCVRCNLAPCGVDLHFPCL
jgi:hypothetical protein